MGIGALRPSLLFLNGVTSPKSCKIYQFTLRYLAKQVIMALICAGLRYLPLRFELLYQYNKSKSAFVGAEIIISVHLKNLTAEAIC